MNRWARRRQEKEIAGHQKEREEYLKRVDARALLGTPPSERDYVVYHCYETVRGKRPKNKKEWMNERGQTGVDGDVSGHLQR